MIKLTIEDLQEIADFKVIEKPLIQKPLIAEADVVTIDNNLSTYVTGTQKRELTVNLGYMDREGYEVLRGFRDRQYENLKYPKATITSDVEIAPDGQIVEGETTKSFNLTTSDNKLDVKSIELAKIGTNEDYVFKDGGKYYVHKAIGKIASYDGETITTSYISTTGALTTGATVYYVLSTPEEYEITKGTLIELKYAKTYAGETTIWSGASDDSLPTKLDYTYSKAGYLQPVQITDSTYERLTDTLDTPVDITKLGGDTFQQTYTGKNLLDISTLEVGYVAYNDGSIVSADPYGERHSNFIKVKPNTTYTFTIVETASSYQNWFGVGEYTTNATSGFIRRDVETTITAKFITFTTASNCQYVMVSARNLASAIMVQLEEGSTPTAWEPYVGGVASPNPDYPQDVVVVTGTQTITTQSKNILPFPYIFGESYTEKGVTAIANPDGSITLKGTHDGSSAALFWITPVFWNYSAGAGKAIELNEGDKIYSSLDGAVSTVQLRSEAYYEDGTYGTIVSSSSPSYTAPQKARLNCRIAVYSGFSQPNGITVYPQYEYGESATSFAKPQKEEYILELAKDYFDISTFEQGGMNAGQWTDTGNRITNIHNPLPVKPSTQYTISVKLGGDVKGFRLGVHQLGKNKNFLSDSNWQQVYRNPYTFTTRADTCYIGIVCSISTTSSNVTTGGSESTATFTDPQAWFRGCTMQIHEPASDIELCKIGNYQDYFYKSGGKWWLHKETGRYTFNDTSIMTWTTDKNRLYVSLTTLAGLGVDLVSPTDVTQNLQAYSERFTATSFQNGYHLATSGAWFMVSSTGAMSFRYIESWTGGDAVKANFLGTKIRYVLATPTNTEVANEELIANLDNLWSTYGCEKYTIISTEADDTGNAKPVLEVTQGDITGKGTEFTLEGTERIPMTYKIFGQAIQDGTPSTSEPVPIETVKGNNSVTFTGPSGQIDYSIVGKMTLADQRIIDNCGTAEQVQVVFRESKQI